MEAILLPVKVRSPTETLGRVALGKAWLTVCDRQWCVNGASRPRRVQTKMHEQSIGPGHPVTIQVQDEGGSCSAIDLHKGALKILADPCLRSPPIVFSAHGEYATRGRQPIGMKNLCQDIARHRGAAALFLGYWLATIVMVPLTWKGGIPGPIVALLLSNSLIWGALISWWRGRAPERTYSVGRRIRGGMLAGVLIAEITFLVTKGGAGDELIGWMRGRSFQGDEVLGFAIAAGLLGVVLGFIGAAGSTFLHHRPQ